MSLTTLRLPDRNRERNASEVKQIICDICPTGLASIVRRRARHRVCCTTLCPRWIVQVARKYCKPALFHSCDVEDQPER